MIIARAIGLSERQIEEIGRAALLHDVGKIYEKYATVLAKQDKLTPEEWAIIQDHPDDGANFVCDHDPTARYRPGHSSSS